MFAFSAIAKTNVSFHSRLSPYWYNTRWIFVKTNSDSIFSLGTGIFEGLHLTAESYCLSKLRQYGFCYILYKLGGSHYIWCSWDFIGRVRFARWAAEGKEPELCGSVWHQRQDELFKGAHVWVSVFFYSIIPFRSFVWKSLLDDRPKPHVCENHWNLRISLKSADFMYKTYRTCEIGKFRRFYLKWKTTICRGR